MDPSGHMAALNSHFTNTRASRTYSWIRRHHITSTDKLTRVGDSPYFNATFVGVRHEGQRNRFDLEGSHLLPWGFSAHRTAANPSPVPQATITTPRATTMVSSRNKELV